MVYKLPIVYLLRLVGISRSPELIPGITSFGHGVCLRATLTMDEGDAFAVVPATADAEKIDQA